MGVYIKDMEMPECCDDCFLYFEDIDESVVCAAGNKVIEKINTLSERPNWCPLIPIPPHGRLGDLNALFEEVYKVWGTEYDASACNTLMGLINDAPTIIPAEE